MQVTNTPDHRTPSIQKNQRSRLPSYRRTNPYLEINHYARFV